MKHPILVSIKPAAAHFYIPHFYGSERGPLGHPSVGADANSGESSLALDEPICYRGQLPIEAVERALQRARQRQMNIVREIEYHRARKEERLKLIEGKALPATDDGAGK